MTEFSDELKTAQSRWPLSCITAVFLAVAAHSSAQAADPLSISFTSTTKKTYGNTLVWQVPAPTGSSMVIKAAPGVIAQTQAVTINWKGFEGTDQVWPTPPPGPASIQLGTGGQASVPIVFGKDSHKQWMITACVKWQPSGYDHKIDDCVYVYLEGIDLVANNAGNLIKIVSPAHPGLSHNWVKIPRYGSTLGVSVHEDVLSKSTNKLVTLKYTSQAPGGWAVSLAKVAPKTLSLSGAASKGGWTEQSAPFTPDPSFGEWLTVKACLTLGYSGEVCSDSYAYRLTTPALKYSVDKNPVVDSGQALLPLPPPSGGGGGQDGKSGNLPAGNANTMAPPPVLGAPTASPPVPRGQPPLPAMAPAVATSPADAVRTAPVAGVPGCLPVPGVPGQYVCAAREAHAGCERLRASAASGIRACRFGGEDQRRR